MIKRTIKLIFCGALVTLVACNASATEETSSQFIRTSKSAAFETDFTVAAEQTVNAVVCIKSYVSPRQQSNYQNPFGGFDPFEFFFGPQQRQPQQRRQQPAFQCRHTAVSNRG